MHLAHLRLPLTSYTHAAHLQEHLVQRLLTHKARPALHPTPPPTVLTAQFQPVYTTGRRDRNSLSTEQEAYLRASGADVHAALRGGQATFHGPGQLVAYPVLDLRAHGLTSRGYIHTLEEVVIRTLARYGICGFRTGNPGVWLSEEEKICALGVHLRRHVSSHGIGLNVSTEMSWFERIVACGLEGKRVVSMEGCGVRAGMEEVGEVFVGELAGLLGVDGVREVREEDLKLGSGL